MFKNLKNFKKRTNQTLLNKKKTVNEKKEIGLHLNLCAENEIKCENVSYLNWFPYVISLFDPSNETSSTDTWFELPAPLMIGFLIYGGSYLVRVVFLLVQM